MGGRPCSPRLRNSGDTDENIFQVQSFPKEGLEEPLVNNVALTPSKRKHSATFEEVSDHESEYEDESGGEDAFAKDET